MATKIVMYTGENCGKCKRAKEMLKSCPVEVDIDEKNVDEKEEYLNELKEIGSYTLPTFIFEDGKTLIGFDENIGLIMDKLGL
ncbi:glutaredoxin family protein [Bacillus thuringiensis]|uniref:glutaredoxin family protein n=1 Tax=Bacillus thuringiensis TaxID=1428 RepID=UPI000BF90C20|nr:glutaredoxin family protein [Bacillus thuringiensis]PFS55807.1 NrdH-redoxin [Bacillus thuringiensis]